MRSAKSREYGFAAKFDLRKAADKCDKRKSGFQRGE
jgi:hypothetical protein